MNTYLYFTIALIPIIWLIVSLLWLKMPGYETTPITLIQTFILSISVWSMPVINSITAGLEGAAMAIWPIVIVTIAAVFIYNLSLYTKSMDVIKNMMIGITTDKRILVLILAWGFGGFLEAIAGFGTAVAIPASILAALGFEPVFAAIICLIANTTPTAFGAIGIPVITLANITNLNVHQLSYAVVLQLAILIVIIPFLLVMITGKSVKAIKGVWGISLASGLAFAIPELLVGKYVGAELPSVLGSIVCLVVTIVWAKVFHKDKANKDKESIPFNKAFNAWLPFLLVLIIIIVSSPLFPSINNTLSQIHTSVIIYRGVGGHPYDFLWIVNPGTLIIIAGIIGGIIQGVSLKKILSIFGKTVKQLNKTIITIVSIVALAKIMSHSGMIKSIAVVFVAAAGQGYPILAPIIGALGTFITGSDTSSNVLFGTLQVEAAKSLGLNPYWLAAANMSGATAGKMISPQSIAVATAATGLSGAEGKILSATIKFCVVYVIILGIIAFLMGRVFGFY